MKYIILLIATLFMFSCGGTTAPKSVSTKTIYPSDTAFLSNAADMRITAGTENFWKLSDPTENVVESKKFDFNDTKSYKLSEVNLDKYQIMEEVLNIDGETIARGISNIININNLQALYPIFLIPINKAITLLSEEMGIDKTVKNLEGHTVTKLPNGKILIWGGKDVNGYTSKVYVFSPEKLAVEALNSNIARAFHTATLYYLDTSDKNNPKKPRVLISGGINDNGYIDVAEVFNPETNNIEKLPAQVVSKKINQSTIVTQSGFVYLLGGKYSDNGEEKYSDDIVSFNTIGKTFSELTKLPTTGLENTTATYIGGGKAIIAGGNDANTVSNKVFLFDSNTSEISLIGALQHKRTKHSAVLHNGKVYFIGGFSEHSGNTFSSPIETIEAATPSSVLNICDLGDIPRGDITVNKVNANTIIIAGGHNGDNKPIANSQIVELRSESCMKSVQVGEIPLNNPRYGAKSVLTSTGLTLIVGGISDDNDNSSSIMEVMTVIP